MFFLCIDDKVTTIQENTLGRSMKNLREQAIWLYVHEVGEVE